jgi:membrane protease YdiL (CAAX protease family)
MIFFGKAREVDEQEPSPGHTQLPAGSDAPATNPPPIPSPGPWGLWATAGWSVLIAFGFVATGIIVGIGYVVIAGFANQIVPNETLESNGLFVSVTTCATTPVTIALCVLFAWLRRGISVKDYLGIRRVPPRAFVYWCVALLAVLVAFDLVNTWLGRPIVPDVMIQTYRTASLVPLLWVAVIIGAPLAEEIFFRGFIFRGVEHSRLGPTGAILLTAAAWAIVHLQYDWFDMGSIFVLGLLLGVVRARTGSIVPGLVMHAITNLVATIQVALLVG